MVVAVPFGELWFVFPATNFREGPLSGPSLAWSRSFVHA